jgi:predicted  nucleic acid-binding Zn-ribbon protein
MKLTYNPEKNTCLIEVNGQSEEVVYDALLDMLPEKLIRDRWLVNEIMKNRTSVVKNLGGLNEYILRLTTNIAAVNEKISKLDPAMDGDKLKFYNSVISDIKAEKDVVREIRHGIRASHAEEGRLAKELAELENVRA